MLNSSSVLTIPWQWQLNDITSEWFFFFSLTSPQMLQENRSREKWERTIFPLSATSSWNHLIIAILGWCYNLDSHQTLPCRANSIKSINKKEGKVQAADCTPLNSCKELQWRTKLKSISSANTSDWHVEGQYRQNNILSGIWDSNQKRFWLQGYFNIVMQYV